MLRKTRYWLAKKILGNLGFVYNTTFVKPLDAVIELPPSVWDKTIVTNCTFYNGPADEYERKLQGGPG